MRCAQDSCRLANKYLSPRHAGPVLHFILAVSLRFPTTLGMEVLAGLAFLIAVNGNCAETNNPDGVARRPRVALVLSGGAARGSAHVGVLKVIEENRIPIDFIAGTSMGAIVGGMYASGLSPDELKEILTSTDWNDLFTDRPARKHLSFRRKEEDLESL